MTPYDPRLTCDPTKKIEDLKLFICTRFMFKLYIVYEL